MLVAQVPTAISKSSMTALQSIPLPLFSLIHPERHQFSFASALSRAQKEVRYVTKCLSQLTIPNYTFPRIRCEMCVGSL